VQLEQELRSRCSIGYVSDAPVSVSEFRRIRATTKEKGIGGAGARPVLGAAVRAIGVHLDNGTGRNNN